MQRRNFLLALTAAALTTPAAAVNMPGKISLYGDSTTAGFGYASRMMARQPNKIMGVNDYSRGGNSFADNLAGTNGLFGGLTFAQHVAQVDDAAICVIRLGGNSIPDGWVGGDPQASLGADFVSIGAQCLQHIQYARAAGKTVVLVGTPYTNIDKAATYFGLTTAQAVSELQKVRNVNTAIRHVASMYGAVTGVPVPFIATHGLGGDGLHPAATAADVYDGVHPTQDYANRVADYLADTVVGIGSF